MRDLKINIEARDFFGAAISPETDTE